MIRELYFKWLCSLVCDPYHSKYYVKLLKALSEAEFTWKIPIDENRAMDGIDLRVRFADQNELTLTLDYYPLDGPCSVLEMMIGLALRCEEDIMVDIDYGDRTDLWFWNMVKSMGLYSMDDENFDETMFDNVIETMLSRTYRRDGKGGLFTILGCSKDLREVELWYQMLWYLDHYIDQN